MPSGWQAASRAASAVAKGAAEVTASDVLQGPLDRAKAVGAEHTINVATDPMPVMAYDLVFECSGVAAAISPALTAVRRAGTVVQVGMLPNEKVGINLAPFVSKEVTYLGSFRFDDEIDEAIELLADYPRFASVITHVVPVDQVVEAFEIARDSQASGKVVVSLWLDA
jgi:L-idonate 5-dehydrogenase